MDRCDALIVGGGPAGSTCAWKLRQAGLDVVVVDAAVFPREKPCAGWITPQVLTELRLDIEEYQRGRTLQPLTGFRVGLIGGGREVHTAYGHPVSFGIRRCEFDHYLLQRAGARLALGAPVTSLRKTGGDWVVNDSIRAPVLIGAGGQFCPVARWINGPLNAAPLVVAQEAEVPIDRVNLASCAIDGEVPELYFCRDLKGYGWCVRKGAFLNVGLGRLDRRSLPDATAAFVAYLSAKARISPRGSWRWRGHAYALSNLPRRRIVGAGVMLVGDAAGLAYPQSGEGIRPAVESGLLAAEAIADANGQDLESRLQAYEERLRTRLAAGSLSGSLPGIVPADVGTAIARRLLAVPMFVRRLVLDQWFLHRHEPALASGGFPPASR